VFAGYETSCWLEVIFTGVSDVTPDCYCVSLWLQYTKRCFLDLAYVGGALRRSLGQCRRGWGPSLDFGIMPTWAVPFVGLWDNADVGGALRWTLGLCRRGRGPSLDFWTMPTWVVPFVGLWDNADVAKALCWSFETI